MSQTKPEKEWISYTDECYAKYFFHRDGHVWHCIVHIHLGDDNDMTYHATAFKKKKARKVAQLHVELHTRSLRKKHPTKLNEEKLVYTPDSKLLSIDAALPTSREDDESDNAVNGDSLPYPKVTKKQLDREMDEHWAQKKLDDIDEDENEGEDELSPLHLPSQAYN